MKLYTRSWIFFLTVAKQVPQPPWCDNSKIRCMVRVMQVFVTGDQHVRETVQGSSGNPLIVRVALGPRSRSDGRNYFCILTNECNNLTNLMRRQSQLILKYSFEFCENRLPDKKLVFREYDLEYVPAKAPGSEGGYQNIGIQ